MKSRGKGAEAGGDFVVGIGGLGWRKRSGGWERQRDEKQSGGVWRRKIFCGEREKRFIDGMRSRQVWDRGEISHDASSPQNVT